MKNIQHLIFDFDGTLVDSKAIFIEAYNNVASEYGYRLMDTTTSNVLKGMRYQDRVKYLNITWWRLPLFISKLYKQYEGQVNKLFFFDGIENILKQVNELGFTMDIVSSNTESYIRNFFSRQPNMHFKNVLCSRKILRKDTLITKLIKHNGYKQSETLYIGDEVRDLQACNRLGIDSIWVAWGYDNESAIAKHSPTYTAQKPEDLFNILKEIKTASLYIR